MRSEEFQCELITLTVKNFAKWIVYTVCHCAAKEAVEAHSMELDLEKEDLNRIGVIYGVGIGGIHTFEEEVLIYTLTKDTVGPKFSPFFIPKMIADIASGQISIMYGFHGPNFTTLLLVHLHQMLSLMHLTISVWVKQM